MLKAYPKLALAAYFADKLCWTRLESKPTGGGLTPLRGNWRRAKPSVSVAASSPYFASPASSARAQQRTPIYTPLSVRLSSSADAAEADAKPPQLRSSAVTPAYTQVDNRSSPLATAFRAGAIAATSARSAAPASFENVEAASSRSNSRPGTADFINPDAAQNSNASGCVRQTSILRFAAAKGASASRSTSSSSRAEHPWPFRLRLRNPHQLCYVNSSTTAMIHVLCLIQSPELRSLVALCRQAAEAGTMLSLHSQLVVRSLPRWQYNAEQKDASEFLLLYLQVSAGAWSRWESRRVEEGVLRILDHGGRMLFVDMYSEDHSTLTALLARWCQGHVLSGVAEERSALVVQLGRYVNGRKNTTLVDFDQVVEAPTFTEGVEQRQRHYMVQAAIAHQGPLPTSGHYRSLLRHGQQWGYSDDGLPAQSVTLDEHHKRNAYVLLLVPVAQV